MEMQTDTPIGAQARGVDVLNDRMTTARYAHPDDVVEDKALTIDAKREILAGWISDAHAMTNHPWLRRPVGFALRFCRCPWSWIEAASSAMPSLWQVGRTLVMDRPSRLRGDRLSRGHGQGLLLLGSAKAASRCFRGPRPELGREGQHPFFPTQVASAA
jgi:hypothetical protein